MGAITRLSIDLPDDIIKAVREQVASGQYASESEVIQEGIRALKERDEPVFDEAVEQWLRTEVVRAYDAVKAGRSQERSIDEVQAALDAAHERALRGE